jgi:hypothetical protein
VKVPRCCVAQVEGDLGGVAVGVEQLLPREIEALLSEVREHCGPEHLLEAALELVLVDANELRELGQRRWISQARVDVIARSDDALRSASVLRY